MTRSSSVAVRTLSMTQSVFEQCIGNGLSPSRTSSRRPCQGQAIIELGLTCSNPAPGSFLGLYDGGRWAPYKARLSWARVLTACSGVLPAWAMMSRALCSIRSITASERSELAYGGR